MDELAAFGTTAHYYKGELLLRPSDSNDEIFLLRKGIVRSYTISSSGDKNIQLMYQTAEIFPVAHLVNKRLQNVYYEAITDCEVVRIPAPKVTAYLQQHDRVGFEVLGKVIQEFIVYKARVDVLEYRFARERVAYQLLLLSKRFGRVEDEQIVMPHFSQDVLAESCNVSRESVNRELKRFERLGYLRREQGQLHIVDPVSMRKQVAPLDTPLFIDDL